MGTTSTTFSFLMDSFWLVVFFIWTPPLREQWSFPFLPLQIFMVTKILGGSPKLRELQKLNLGSVSVSEVDHLGNRIGVVTISNKIAVKLLSNGETAIHIL